MVVGLRTDRLESVQEGLGVELGPGVVQQFLNILFLETFHLLKKFEGLEEFWFVWVIFIDIYYIRN